MHALLDESFDRYGRYAIAWQIRQSSLPDRPLRILDVGDPYGMLGRLFSNDFTVSADFFHELPESLHNHVHVNGSGLALPFADASFDFVCSHDALEHVPDEHRSAFVDELLRVSAGPVLIVAPFADPRTTLCERLVNSFYVARIGHSLQPLDEHAACALPLVDDIVEHAAQSGVAAEVFGDGWLFHWLPLMLIKGHAVSAGDRTLERRIDAACNLVLPERDRRAPHYRRAIVLRPPEGLPDFARPSPPSGDTADDERRLVSLAAGITMALPRGDNPAYRLSRLRTWIDANADGPGDDPISEAARSLALVFAEVDDAIAKPATTTPHPVEHAPADERVRVAVVIVNLNGIEHLPDCLDSLERQSYPRDLFEVIVVDNGSEDGSLELLADRYPTVTVLPQGKNLGFSPAVTIGVTSAANAECVALLNNDMRADPDWLLELTRAYRPSERVVCVAGMILDWNGEHLDFGEGTLNFGGHGGQVGFGRPAEDVHLVDGQDLLFACGGSMLVSRAVYLDSGGFDPNFFAYFEDTDFGWRLQVLGYRTVLAAQARSFHRHHGTSSRFPNHERILLYERNALRSVIKNYDDEHLHAALGPALLLLARRAVTRGNLDRSEFDIGRFLPDEVKVSRTVLAHLHAINDVVDDLDNLFWQRREIQAARRQADVDIVERFGRPLLPVLGDEGYLASHQRIVEDFGLVKPFGRERAYRVLVVSADEIGAKMRGPAIRAWEVAKALAGSTDVMVAAPAPTDLQAPGVGVEVYHDTEGLVALARLADVVLVQGYVLHHHPGLATTNAILVVDLYDPWLFENLEIHGLSESADVGLRNDVQVLNELIDAGDFFVCASERQRDYWLGMLSARGRLDSGTYARDPSLRDLVDVVPFGLEHRQPRHIEPVLKGVHPSVAVDDLVVLWGGGTWDWFDPVTVVEAFPDVLRSVPNAKLYFLGLQLAGPNVAAMRTATTVVERARALGLDGTAVIFGDWAPYELREAYLLESDVAVSAARDVAETRLAFRSRLLDYFWAGLPVVTTEGDVLADIVRQQGLGAVVPTGDPQRMAEALVVLLSDEQRRRDCGQRARRVATDFTWSKAVTPLRRVADAPWRWRNVRQLRGRITPATEDAHALIDQYRGQLGSFGHIVAEQQGQIEGLQRSLRHYEHRMAQLRRIPLASSFGRVKRLRQRLRGTGPIDGKEVG